ncbi:MAG TPA: hypothetical protein VIW29_12980 [Polyangiaceae bacterium]
MKALWRRSGLAALVTASAVACGVSGRNVDTSSGDPGGEAGNATTGASGGSGATGNVGASGGVPEQPEGGTAGADGGGAPPDRVCEEGSAICVENAPTTCRDDAWVKGDTCSGNLPACSNGVCALARIVGGLVDIAPLAGQAGAIRLVDHSFHVAPTTCGKVAGNDICVTGGIRP